ncbi:MAG: NeuD/PglB/VioB family sugar acetyltransferase [Elusimicrobia bacterium]|nr:NeuD/PglB/VioB family sugar acetyltransferase [Elusimicrobiota bacterium]
MRKDSILLVGCGEHARMTIDNIEDQGRYRIVGLTTNAPSELGREVYGYPVLCLDEGIPALLDARKGLKGYILGIGDMKVRRAKAKWLDALLPAVNVVHPAAIVSRHAAMGTGNLIEAYAKVANGARIGSHCIINSFSAVNHDQTIGDNVLIAGNVSMAGKRVGDDTIVADGASIGFKRSVGSRCIIGDGAVVTRDIPDGSIAYGNPARVVRKNDW